MPVLSAAVNDPIQRHLIAESARNGGTCWAMGPVGSERNRDNRFLTLGRGCVWEMARLSEGCAMSTHKLFSLALYLVAADYVNSANAQQVEVTKAEATLAA